MTQALSLEDLDRMDLGEAQRLPYPIRDKLLDLIIGDGRRVLGKQPEREVGLLADFVEEDLLRLLKVKAVRLSCSGFVPVDRAARSAAVIDREARSAAVIDREARSAAVIDREARSAAVIDREARSAAVNDQGDDVPTLDPRAQFRLCFDNVKSAVERMGSTLDRVTSLTVFLKNMDYWGQMNEIYREYFRCPPARATIGAVSLSRNYQIEVAGLVAYKVAAR